MTGAIPDGMGRDFLAGAWVEGRLAAPFDGAGKSGSAREEGIEAPHHCLRINNIAIRTAA